MTNSVNTVQEHIPVMVSETLSFLAINRDGVYFDGTLGPGGHAGEILSLLSPRGHLIGADRDKNILPTAQNHLSEIANNFSLNHKSYSDADAILRDSDYSCFDGIVLDLGLSSAQLNNRQRGFSFMENGALDMRFDQSQSKTAAQILATSTENEIAEFIRLYSEERYANKIAYRIKQADKMETVDDIREAIRRATPPNKRNRSFARVFQALRIVVNDELEKLELFLDHFIELLCVGGRIVIISFHSLEDRLVKLAFRNLKLENRLTTLTKKPVTASTTEISQNSRAKSAKLRAGEKVK